MPKISVIMPVYNTAKFVYQSVMSIISQTMEDFELIIINDNSTDDSLEVISNIEDSRIKVLSNRNRIGQENSINKGLKFARGKFIAIHDSDDISRPNRLLFQYKFLNSHNDIHLLGTQFDIIDSNSVRITTGPYKSETHIGNLWTMCLMSDFAHTSVMIRAKTLKFLGGYNPQFSPPSDYELWSRVVRKYKTANLRENLVSYRFHESSLSNRRKLELVRMHKIIQKSHIEYFLRNRLSNVRLDSILNFRYGMKESNISDIRSSYFNLRNEFETLYPESFLDVGYQKAVSQQLHFLKDIGVEKSLIGKNQDL